MGLVVLRDDLPGPVEDVGGIEEPLRPFVRHAAADDVDIQLPCQGGENGLCPLPVPVGAGLQILGEKPGVPGFWQDCHVRMFRPCGGADQLLRAGKIPVRLAQAHVHLNAGNFHKLPPYRRIAVSRAIDRYRS